MLRYLSFFLVVANVAFAQLQVAQESAPDLDTLEEGDLLPEGGVYWPLKDGGGQINLRFYDGNKLRLYFIDDGGKIMKPTFPVALARYYNDLRASIKVPRDVAKLTVSPSGLYLTSPRVLQQPLRYRVWVVLQHIAPNASATEDDALTPDKQSYGLRILSGLGKQE